MKRPTVEDIHQYREVNGCGLIEARSKLSARWRKGSLRELRERIGEANTVEACREVVADLIAVLLED